MPKDPVASIAALLSYYSFDLGSATIDQVVKEWLEEYPPKWVIAAVVEAIFLGRYKVASVDNILLTWDLGDRPQPHYDSEFADLVCNKLFKEIPSDSPTPKQPPEKSLVKTLKIPDFNHSAPATPTVAAMEPTPTATNPFHPVQSTGKVSNKGIGKWLKFATKLP